VLQLLRLPECEVDALRARLRQHDHTDIPGAVRVSLGLQNTHAEVGYLVHALQRIAERRFAAEYVRTRTALVVCARGPISTTAVLR